MIVDVLVPRREWSPRTASESIAIMEQETVRKGVTVREPICHAMSIPAAARNKSLFSVGDDADFVLFCDDDMAPPKNALLDLLAHDTDVVSGYCTTRDRFPLEVACSVYNDQTDGFEKIDVKDKYNSTDGKAALLKGKFGVGAAFLLVKKAALDEAIEFHLSAQDWLRLNQKMFNRLHVRSEMREKERRRVEDLRRAMHERGETYLFQHSWDDACYTRGEDIHLSWVFIQMGKQIWIDTSVEILHIGQFGYGPSLLGVRDARELRVA